MSLAMPGAMRTCTARGTTMIEVCLLTVALSVSLAGALRLFGGSVAKAALGGASVLDAPGANGEGDRVRLPAPEPKPMP